MGLDEPRGVGLAAPTLNERQSALREAIALEDPNLRRGVEALIWKQGFATTREGVAAIAEEILQETCMRALARAEMFDPTRPAHSWLFIFAVNVVRERQRERQTTQERILQNAGKASTDPESKTASEIALQRLHDTESTCAYRVIELLDLVPPAEREILRCRYVQNLRGPELAAALGGISEGAARVRVSRAKAMLAQAYMEAEGKPTRSREGS